MSLTDYNKIRLKQTINIRQDTEPGNVQVTDVDEEGNEVKIDSQGHLQIGSNTTTTSQKEHRDGGRIIVSPNASQLFDNKLDMIPLKLQTGTSTQNQF